MVKCFNCPLSAEQVLTGLQNTYNHNGGGVLANINQYAIH